MRKEGNPVSPRSPYPFSRGRAFGALSNALRSSLLREQHQILAEETQEVLACLRPRRNLQPFDEISISSNWSVLQAPLWKLISKSATWHHGKGASEFFGKLDYPSSSLIWVQAYYDLTAAQIFPFG